MYISVVIPAYEVNERFPIVIAAISGQLKGYEFEIIVVDDGSVTPIASRFPEVANLSGVRIIRQGNLGVGVARDVGISEARGSLIALCDSDDVWLEGSLAERLTILDNDPRVLMVGCLTNSPSSTVRHLRNQYNETSFYIKLSDQLRKNYFQPSTVIFKRIALSFFKKDKYFNIGWKSNSEEGYFFGIIAANGMCVLVNKVLVDYDGGKAGFGVKGLSASIIRQQLGEYFNIFLLHRAGAISRIGLVKYLIFYSLKFLRRLTILLLRRLNIFSRKSNADSALKTESLGRKVN